METKIEEFIKLIDKALGIAEQLKQPEFSNLERLNSVISHLQSIRIKAQAGKLEPSGGSLTLGLSREVADWIEPLDSPLLDAVGEIEQYYQKHL